MRLERIYLFWSLAQAVPNCREVSSTIQPYDEVSHRRLRTYRARSDKYRHAAQRFQKNLVLHDQMLSMM
jgi:CDP-glycerol glycerophosphotransferase (TagB/SpsB family)